MLLDTDPTLFQTARFPQNPQKCTMSTPKATGMLRRRLSESSVDELAAEKACEHWGEGKDDCVFDALMTGDLEMAMVGANESRQEEGLRGVEELVFPSRGLSPVGFLINDDCILI
jgi:hypothetical protein